MKIGWPAPQPRKWYYYKLPWAEKGVLHSNHFQGTLRVTALSHSKPRTASGQNDGVRIIPNLFLWQEFLRLKWISERKPFPVTFTKGWKLDCSLWVGKVRLCSHHFPSYCTQLQRGLYSFIYLLTLLKRHSLKDSNGQKTQARGTALVSLNCLRSASWEAQSHQSSRASSPGGSLRWRDSAEHWGWNSWSFLGIGNELIPDK